MRAGARTARDSPAWSYDELARSRMPRLGRPRARSGYAPEPDDAFGRRGRRAGSRRPRAPDSCQCTAFSPICHRRRRRPIAALSAVITPSGKAILNLQYVQLKRRMPLCRRSPPAPRRQRCPE
ncbi:hypothetical protein EVAR_96979_1 [Eumeta japonica]|uniref:Uncharacterized protein n=1 Tax=Eumeta variegata TaxID=151549 RepID=A0A4C1VGX7_EUMVA|nr:hypothetical protein EVAR_96979_1 [Eumeta japonica]